MNFFQLLSLSLLVCFIQAASVSPASVDTMEDPYNETKVRTPSRTISGFKTPIYIQIVGNEVFLTENKGKVQVLDVHTGARLRSFSIPSGHPHGLFVRGNRVLVTNTRQETYSFTLSGELYGVHYSPKTVSVALDYNGLMYINEWTTCKINVYNIDGTKFHTFSVGNSCYPRKIQFDKQGNLYVGEHHSKAVFVFDRSGSLIRKISLPTVSFMDGIHLNPLDEDFLYVADRSDDHRSGKVLKVKIATGKVVEKFTGLSGANDIAVGPNGKVWVVDIYGNSIKIY
uniref:SMP-30/Gluconolactonase/LRE-like region domain-containing protein n=1 Tax=Amphimedon queenslandica TaxID=400682 RepID=A0A1X7V203_AMPQE